MKRLLLVFIILMLILCINSIVYASTADKIEKAEYSDAYKNYLNLSEEQKDNFEIIPSPYELLQSNYVSNNPLKKMAKVGANLETKFSLKDNGILPNLPIHTQNPTSLCWAFSIMSSLETHLDLNNISNGRNPSYYDFSESHMDYSAVRNFKDGTNKYGILRTPGSSASWYVPIAYLTNGQGAINESGMNFENYKEKENPEYPYPISLSEIQNKTVQTEVFDINLYPVLSDLDIREEVKSLVKSYVKNYGSMGVQIFFGDAKDMDGVNRVTNDYYNISTGALFTDFDYVNHAVSIIGWDDNYSVSNFNSDHRPSKNGAWIARNSFGTNFGKNGLFYISYEDANVYTSMIDITKASSEKTYDNIYQYNEQGNILNTAFKHNDKTLYMGNYFETKQSSTEMLTHVGIFAQEPYNCKVFVNPNGKSMAKSDLQQVTLKEGNGEEENIYIGYHTLEFKEPIQINSNEFAVVIEINGQRNINEVMYAAEASYPNADEESYYFEYRDINISNSKCFIASKEDFNNNNWTDLTKINLIRPDLPNADSTIKAFTVNNVIDHSLNRIAVTREPNKKAYIEGENFDKTGMQVTAYFNDNTNRVLSDSDYSLSNASNLKVNQTSVTITYQDKTTTQPITVSAKTTPTPTVTPTVTPTTTPTVTPSVTPTATPTITPTVTPTTKPTTSPTPVPTVTVTPKPDTRNPQNSNLSNLRLTVDSVQSDKIDVSINNFLQNKNNEKMEYYYYISNSKNEDLTKAEFIGIKDLIVSGNSLKFHINKLDLKNFNELVASDKIYLYLKEVASVGSNQSISISSGLDMELSKSSVVPQTPGDKDTNSGSTTSINDDTVAKDPIPQTGSTPVIFIVMAIISIIGLVIFIRYLILKKYQD